MNYDKILERMTNIMIIIWASMEITIRIVELIHK